jgi:L-iditol 2-dehydrogenase
MKVVLYHSNNDLRLEEAPRPIAGRGELLMRIEASGICGSDVMEWYRIKKAPLVLGHEVAGIVEQVGDGVEGFNLGDRIVATHHVPCNTCRYCRTDRHSVCETLRTTTFDPGGFAQYVRLPPINVERGVVRIPDHVGFAEASFVEPLACVLRALRVSGLKPGMTVAVLGSGISGLLMIQAAKSLGAGEILATDLSDYRLQQAQRFGATKVERADRLDTASFKADQVLVCAAAPAVIPQALELVEPGGTILFFAPFEPGSTYPMPMFDIWKNNVSIVHSYAGPPADMAVAMEMIAAGRVDVAGMITHRLPLSETARGFELMLQAGESLKIVIEPWKEE